MAILAFGDPADFDPSQTFKHLPWECWGLNFAPAWTEFRNIPWARFYQLHPWETACPEEIAWAKHCRKKGIPVYVFNRHRKEWANHVLDWVAKGYPLQSIKHALIGNRFRNMDGFFASSFSYMVAHALYEGVPEIGLFGAHLLAGSPRERMVEYPALLWWLGYAKAKGVRITLQQGSDLLSYPYRYGLDYTQEVQWVRKRVRSLSLQRDEKIDEAWEPKGLPVALAQVTP